jgi:hypothetical protein
MGNKSSRSAPAAQQYDGAGSGRGATSPNNGDSKRNGNGSNGVGNSSATTSVSVSMLGSIPTSLSSIAQIAEAKMDFSESSLSIDDDQLDQLSMSYANRRHWQFLLSLLQVRRIRVYALTHCLIRCIVVQPREVNTSSCQLRHHHYGMI